MSLSRSSTSGYGSELRSINVSYSVEENAVNSVTLSLSSQQFTPASTITNIPVTPSAFTLTPGNYNGVLTVDTPAYANGSAPEYYLLTVSVTVDTSVVTELRINDIELVYQENVGNSLPNNVNIAGYLRVGSLSAPAADDPGATSVNTLNVGVDVDMGPPNVITTLSDGTTMISATRTNVIAGMGTDSTGTLIGGIIDPDSAVNIGYYQNLNSSVILKPDAPLTVNSVNVAQAVSYLDGPGAITASAIRAVFGSNAFAGGNHNISIIEGARLEPLTFTPTASGSITVNNIRALRVRSAMMVPNVAATVAQAMGVQVVGAQLDASSTIGNNSGMVIENMGGVGVTNARGVVILDQTGSANNFALYIAGSVAGPGGGITFGLSADTSMWRGAAGQLLTPGDWMSRHYLCSSTPTIAAGPAAGTGPTIAITGTDHGFRVALTTGTTATANATLFTVTFGAAWTSTGPIVTWSPGNAATSSLALASIPFTSAITTTTMTFTSNTSALADSTAYVFLFTAMR